MPLPKGNIPWNKGLTKENSEKIREMANYKKGKERIDLKEKYKGEGNPHYKNGIVTGKRIMFEMYSICEICGNENNLEIHHKDKNRKNNKLDNLQLLCKSCHSKQHRSIEWHNKILSFRRFNKNG